MYSHLWRTRSDIRANCQCLSIHSVVIHEPTCWFFKTLFLVSVLTHTRLSDDMNKQPDQGLVFLLRVICCLSTDFCQLWKLCNYKTLHSPCLSSLHLILPIRLTNDATFPIGTERVMSHESKAKRFHLHNWVRRIERGGICSFNLPSDVMMNPQKVQIQVSGEITATQSFKKLLFD